MKTLKKPGLRLKLAQMESLIGQIAGLPDTDARRIICASDRDNVRREIIDHLERALAHVHSGRIWLAREELFE